MINEIINAAKTNYVETLSFFKPEKETFRTITEAGCLSLFKEYLDKCNLSSIEYFYENRKDDRIGGTMLLIWICQKLINDVEKGEDCELSIIMLWGLVTMLVDSPFIAFCVGTVRCVNEHLIENFNYELPSFLLGCCA